MEVVFVEKSKKSGEMEVASRSYMGLYVAVSRIIELLRLVANLARTDQDALSLYYHNMAGESVCEMYHGFFASEHNLLLTNLLKQELYEGVCNRNLAGFADGFIGDFMPRFLDNPENDVENKIKAVFVVLYGRALRREDIERLVKVKWEELLPAVQLAEEEGMSVVEVLNLVAA